MRLEHLLSGAGGKIQARLFPTCFIRLSLDWQPGSKVFIRIKDRDYLSRIVDMIEMRNDFNAS